MFNTANVACEVTMLDYGNPMYTYFYMENLTLTIKDNCNTISETYLGYFVSMNDVFYGYLGTYNLNDSTWDIKRYNCSINYDC